MEVCGICGHEWIARIEGKKPEQCPKCKSYDWDEPPEETGEI